MYDTVFITNLSNDFKHRFKEFQTKCLECDLSEYTVFNNRLWMQYDGSNESVLETAKPVDFTGVIYIYTSIISVQKKIWVEYALKLEKGHILSFDCVNEEVQEDLSDLSRMRPIPKSKSSCVHIDFRGVNNAVLDDFHKDIDVSLQKIRSALGDPNAEIIYQAKLKSSNDSFTLGCNSKWIHSIVQNINDLN